VSSNVNPEDVVGIRRLMIFVDVGYVRGNLKSIFYDDILDYSSFIDIATSQLILPHLFFDKIRIYYYDALPESPDPREKMQQLHIRKIKDTPGFEDVLGNLKKSKKMGQKQKGVDTQIAIDMLSKAYEDHYDIAVLIAGDEDFLPVVEAVKNTGKRVYGVYFESHISNDLKESFDRHLTLTRRWFAEAALKVQAIIPEFKLDNKIQKDMNINWNVKIEFSMIKGLVKLLIVDSSGIEYNNDYCYLLRHGQGTIHQESSIPLQFMIPSSNSLTGKCKAFVLVNDESNNIIAYRDSEVEII